MKYTVGMTIYNKTSCKQTVKVVGLNLTQQILLELTAFRFLLGGRINLI